MHNVYYIFAGLIVRYRIYHRHYTGKTCDDYRKQMKDNGGFFLSLIKEIKAKS